MPRRLQFWSNHQDIWQSDPFQGPQHADQFTRDCSLSFAIRMNSPLLWRAGHHHHHHHGAGAEGAPRGRQPGGAEASPAGVPELGALLRESPRLRRGPAPGLPVHPGSRSRGQKPIGSSLHRTPPSNRIPLGTLDPRDRAGIPGQGRDPRADGGRGNPKLPPARGHPAPRPAGC